MTSATMPRASACSDCPTRRALLQTPSVQDTAKAVRLGAELAIRGRS